MEQENALNPLPWWIRATLVAVAALAFIAVRLRFSHWFGTDPLTLFFNTQYGMVDHATLPELPLLRTLALDYLRFLLNLFSGLLLVHGIAQRARLTKQVGIALFALSLLVLVPYTVALAVPLEPTLIFYLRRLLIQPLFLIVLLPVLFRPSILGSRR